MSLGGLKVLILEEMFKLQCTCLPGTGDSSWEVAVTVEIDLLFRFAVDRCAPISNVCSESSDRAEHHTDNTSLVLGLELAM